MAEILILSAGRRVSLLRAFEKASHEYGLRVSAGDMNPVMSSACQLAAKTITLPRNDSIEYHAVLRDYCVQNDVRLVVPTLDTELARLSKMRDEFAAFGCTIAVSEPDLIAICRDKRETATHFEKFGLRSPALFDPNALQFPVLVKPYDGSLSAGISILRSPEEVTPDIVANPKNIFCAYLEPRDFEEFTCDAYFNSNGDIRCVVPRLRVEVRGGEVSKGRTAKNDIVPFLFSQLAQLPGARGCMTIQIMRHKETGALFLIEINPRFGGGYPLTARCGAAYHQWLIDEYVNGIDVPVFDDWTDNLTMLRYDAEVFVG